MIGQQLLSKKFFQSLHFKIPLLFGLLFFASFQLVATLFNRQLEAEMVSTFTTQIHSRSETLATGATALLTNVDDSSLQSKAHELVASGVGRDVINIQMINQKSEIIAVLNQTEQINVGMYIRSLDVSTVLKRGERKSHQYTIDANGTKQRVLRVITPIFSSNHTIIGAVIIDANIESVYTQLETISNLFMNIMIIVLMSTIVLAIFVANRTIAKPVTEIQKKTELIAEGEYNSEDINVSGNDELSLLARSINELAIKIREANATTESERQRLDSVLAHMSDGVIATDRRGNIVIINEEALQLLDETRENVLYASIMDVFKIRQKYTYRQLLETKDELILSIQNEHVESIIKCEFSVIKRESGFISGIVCVLSDITEQEKVERERREFVSNVSHELRTPLTSMRSYTESLIDGAWQDAEIAPQFLGVIQSETDRMIRMVTDLLLLSKMDSGQQSLEFEMIDVCQLLQNILDRFDMLLSSEEYAHKQYEIIRHLSDKPLWIEGDQDKLIRVIDNILNNAIKYSPDGGQITCRLVESGDNIVISVSDQGLGIPKKAIAHVFQRFYRVDKARSREQGGTGLGLAISKDVIELHGGKIWATSIENQGSTFFISLKKVDFFDIEEWG
ncbi:MULTISPECIES: cell wall metabolism sensor histidine kinase WalK [unclassified Granulicatella]|uniref:cell wall metabolism sensor histidine kinase WalK n=1 Tax=unclassified Granulicatella TaxID=2630493 RepID=UPI0010733262|nr:MULTISPECIES: cell wall metabolism sensor histidine kinase WalK [unclassified Granulicatella]MBF0780580.1 cell wall metabolism sensor histidine kinase WalK [Granulicatella sp. 19428wC4_WM01]TFU94889.1 cell wall metabolism sensor histidine kinase WalK [Granulicatella sp. WM01]